MVDSVGTGRRRSFLYKTQPVPRMLPPRNRNFHPRICLLRNKPHRPCSRTVRCCRHASSGPFTNLVGDFIGVAPVRTAEIDIVGDEKLAGSDSRCPDFSLNCSRAKIRLPFRFGQFCLQALVFTGAHVGQVAPPFGFACSVFVEIDAISSSVTDALPTSGRFQHILPSLHRQPGQRGTHPLRQSERARLCGLTCRYSSAAFCTARKAAS